jgi:hypothetical protein
MRFPRGTTRVEVIPEFIWPGNAGIYSGAMFYAGLTDPEVTTLLGDFDVVSFGWE